MKTHHGTNDYVPSKGFYPAGEHHDGIHQGIKYKAKSKALGELKDLLAAGGGPGPGMAEPESAEHAAPAFSVTRKGHAGEATKAAKPLDQHPAKPEDKRLVEGEDEEGPAHEAKESPEEEHMEHADGFGDLKTHSLKRANPGDASMPDHGDEDMAEEKAMTPEHVDKALKHFLVKPKKKAMY